MKRSRLHRKPPGKRTGQDDRYLTWLRKQPCIICESFRYVEAAHVGARGLGQTCPDRQAVPLCPAHHRTGVSAHHVLGKAFWRFHGISREGIIAVLVERYAAEVRKAA